MVFGFGLLGGHATGAGGGSCTSDNDKSFEDARSTASSPHKQGALVVVLVDGMPAWLAG